MGAIALLLFSFALHGDSALDVHTVFENAAHALGDSNASGFLSAFDSSFPGLGKLRSNVAELLRANDTRSTIAWERNDGNDQTRTVQLNWLLELSERGASSAVTQRRARVECELRNKGGAWRIVSLTPADFFAPPQVDDAWTLLVTSAIGLTESATASSSDAADLPSANTRKFMQAFDPAMPGYSRLSDNILALEQGGEVESSVDLVKNEGDDRVRTIVVDWSLNLVSQETKVVSQHRQETVTCTLEKRGKSWRITAIDPVTLFAPRQ